MATNKNVNTSHTQPCNSYSIHRNTVINCCTKHAMLTQCCWTVCPGEDNESKSRCHKRHSTGKKKKKKKRRRRGEENSSDCDSEFVLKQRDSKCGQSLSPSRRVELPDIIPKQVKKKKKKKLHTHTLFLGFRYRSILSQESLDELQLQLCLTCTCEAGLIQPCSQCGCSSLLTRTQKWKARRDGMHTHFSSIQHGQPVSTGPIGSHVYANTFELLFDFFAFLEAVFPHWVRAPDCNHLVSFSNCFWWQYDYIL